MRKKNVTHAHLNSHPLFENSKEHGLELPVTFEPRPPKA